jgi:hypothetical protein
MMSQNVLFSKQNTNAHDTLNGFPCASLFCKFQSTRANISMNVSADKDSTGTDGSEPGNEASRTAYIHPEDKEELLRVLATFDSYKSLPHLLWSYLNRSLIPRVNKGKCFSGRLLAAVAGRKTKAGGREKVQLSRADWDRIDKAAATLSRQVRHLEEKVAWSGSLHNYFPFRCCGPELIVRAGAREIAAWSRGGPSELFSRAGVPEWQRPEGSRRPQEKGAGDDADEFGRGRGPGKDRLELGPPYQVMRKLPGRDRGGKAVQFAISKDAKRQLKRKASRLSQDGTDLLRRGTLQMIEWVKEAPREALRYIREESDLYQLSREGEEYGFQVYVAVSTKRRLEQAGDRLERSLGRDADRGITQREILQAAARLALESPDEDMLPPLPGDAPR